MHRPYGDRSRDVKVKSGWRVADPLGPGALDLPDPISRTGAHPGGLPPAVASVSDDVPDGLAAWSGSSSHMDGNLLHLDHPAEVAPPGVRSKTRVSALRIVLGDGELTPRRAGGPPAFQPGRALNRRRRAGRRSAREAHGEGTARSTAPSPESFRAPVDGPPWGVSRAAAQVSSTASSLLLPSRASAQRPEGRFGAPCGSLMLVSPYWAPHQT